MEFFPCTINVMSVNASWVPVQSIGVPTDVSTTVSVTHSQSSTSGTSKTWGSAVTKSVSAGFKFCGVSASAEISGTVSHSTSTSNSQTFEQSTTNSTTVTQHYQPGEVWQFQFNIYDNCNKYSTVTTQNTVETPNRALPPCCLPGYFADPLKTSGACAPGEDGQTFSACPPPPPTCNQGCIPKGVKLKVGKPLCCTKGYESLKCPGPAHYHCSFHALRSNQTAATATSNAPPAEQ